MNATGSAAAQFPLDDRLTAAARPLLSRPRFYWLLGGAASGKSTVAARLASEHGLSHLDVDTLVFGSFMGRYRPDRHPASCAWFHAPNPLAWVLDLSWKAFNALTRAADAEALSLLAEDLGQQPAGPLLLDGGFAHPAVVARAADLARIVCLSAPAEARRTAWETDPGRADMRSWIHALPDGPTCWQKFLAFDARQAETMVEECGRLGIPVVDRQPGEKVEDTARRVASLLGLA